MRLLQIAAPLLAVALLSTLGCAEPEASTVARPGVGATQPAAEVAAAARAVAGEGVMCLEHGVLEAVCTKCNPALIAVFQAKGDWCQEHGFPESFCPTCHPERGGLPAQPVMAEEAPATGTRIRFRSKETARLAGIEAVPAVEVSHEAGVPGVGRLAYDAARVAQVNARAAGVVRAVRVDVGSRVQAGTPLADVESAAAAADQSRVRSTASRLAAAQAARDRQRALLEKGIVAAKSVQAAQQELEQAQADHDAAQAALRQVGQSGGDGVYTLVAPLDGIVARRDIHVGTLVDVAQMLFEIVDPSVLWAEIDVAESDLAPIQPGKGVTLTVDGLGEQVFEGRVDFISPAVDPHTRTVRLRSRLSNANGQLRANMYVRAKIAVEGVYTTVRVPRESLQRVRGVPLVFVRLADDLYETRRVDLGLEAPSGVELRRGVRPGELVVTVGSFLLKTETLRESIGAGCCDVEQR